MDGAYMCQESGRYQGIYTLARRAKIIKKKKNQKKLLVQRDLQVCNGQSFIIFTILFNAHNMQTAYVNNKTMHRKLK